MLMLPAYKQYADATVFQDDMQFWTFYVLPGFPSVRVDDKGNPVFLLIKYMLSDESRENDPTLPRGGGYLTFDSELKISDERRAQIAADLQPLVDQEYQRRKQNQGNPVSVGVGGSFRDPVTPGHAGVPNTSIGMSVNLPTDSGAPLPSSSPKVIFGEPLWKSGKVQLNAPSAPGLVRGKIADEPASLLGNNVAAFAMDLTENGASFLQQTLTGSDGKGATDLTPIQVVYQLTMTAHLPPATMNVKVDMLHVYHSLHEMVHTYDDNGCDPDTYSTVESKLQLAIDAGYVHINIDAGGITDQTVVQQLMQQAQALVTQVMKDRFVDQSPSGSDGGSGSSGSSGGGSGNDQNGNNDWGSKDATTGANVYRLKRETNIDLTDIDEVYTIGGATDITLSPQGTLETFLLGNSNMSQFVRTVDLNDPFFMTLALGVRAFANWDTDSIDYVSVQIQYPAGDPNAKVQAFTFTGASRDAQKWDPALVNKSRSYSFQTQVKFKGRDPGPWSAAQTSTDRNLNIGVATPGKLDLQILSAGVDWASTVSLAIVYVHYEDPANNIAALERSFALNDKHPSDAWTVLLYTPDVKPYQYRVDYVLNPTGVLSTNPVTQSSSAIIVPDPSANRLLVTLLPDGVWDDVAHCAVTVSYDDAANDYHVDQQYDLKASDFRQWKVVLKDPAAVDFTVQWVTTFKSGIPNESVGPRKLHGSQVVPLTVSVPYLKVAVAAPSVDWSQIALVQIDFDHPDGSTSLELTASHATDSWLLVLKNAANRTYGYKLTYFPVKGLGDPVVIPRATGDATLLNVPEYQIPRVGADVIPTVVDFAATPVVLVQFDYGTRTQTLSFTDKTVQSWYIPVGASDPTQYTYQVTYTVLDKDGTTSTVAAPPVSTTANKIVIPRYKAS